MKNKHPNTHGKSSNFSSFKKLHDDSDDSDDFDEFTEESDHNGDHVRANHDTNDTGDHHTHDEQSTSRKKDQGEFARLLEESLSQPEKKVAVGDKVRGELLAISGDEVFFSIENSGMPLDGTIPKKELVSADGEFAHRVGDFIELYVTKIRGTKITLSTKPTTKNQAEGILDAYKMSLPIEGRVTEVCKGGVRVSIRGKSAFCPISQLDLSRVETGEEYIGQKLDFLITQISEGGRNIVVSRRKLLQSQKSISEDVFNKEKGVGDIVIGKVKKIEAFGAFVEIALGVEGLLHVSELSWSRVSNPNEVLTVGQEVTVKIIKSETKDNKLRISLSIKQATTEPWEDLPHHIREGQIVDGKVIRCMKFGAFVEIAPGIEGLIPLSEMSYTKRVVRSDQLIKEGERVAVKIKELHLDNKKVLLSLKDAGADPWVLVPQKFPVGTLISGKVERRETYGLFIQLEEGVTGLLPKSKAVAHAEFPYDKLKMGDSVTVQIGEVNTEERRISLSVPQDPHQNEWKSHVTPSSEAPKAKLGDKFKNIVLKK